VCAAALCWAGIYVGIFHGGFSPKVYNEYESNPTAFFPLPGGATSGPGGPAVELTALQLGEKVYKEVCQACHQPTGLGQAGQFPALAGSEWVDGSEYNEKRLVAVVLKGMKGPVTVKGSAYNGAMPPQENALKPNKLAAVLTYVRQAWGNKGGEITEAQVIAAKKEFADRSDQWTVEEIKKIPLDAKLEGAGAPATQAKTEPKPGDTAKPAAPATGSFDLAASIQRGATLYPTSCGTCHMPNGMGLPPVNPPLVGSELVTGDARRTIAIPLKGINGPLKVGATVFPGPMIPPALMFPAVINDDAKLADVLNYVRNTWGNKADAITPEQVKKVRAEFADRPAPWTEAELLNFPPAK
jgi:mono/diheme cytochrome c family protein